VAARITVSGLTKTSDFSHPRQILDSSTQNPRSIGFSRGCWADRRRTPTWCRRARFSRMSAWR